MDIERESALIGQIYDAVMNHSIWSDVLAELVDYTDSKTAIFTACDQLNPKFDFVYSHNIPEAGLLAYSDEQVKVIDMKLHAPLWQRLGLGETLKMNLSSYSTMLGTDEHIFYEKCLKPTGICHVAAALLEQAKYQWAVIAIHRAPSAKPYEQEQLDILHRLAKHMRRSLQIHRQLTEVKQENQDLYQVLNYLKVGVILLDQDCRVQFSNAQAQNILSHSDLIVLDRHSRLQLIEESQHKLDRLILGAMFYTSATNIHSDEIGGTMTLRHDLTQSILNLSVMPFMQIDSSAESNIQEKHTVAIFMTEPERNIILAKHLLINQYRLTPREVSLCELFVQGLDYPEISTQCGNTLSTVRTYFKSIFAKMGCNTQAELMRLLMSYTSQFQHIH